MTCHEKSFANHPRSANWHPTLNGTTTPRQVTRATSKKYQFKCDKCPHNFPASLDKVNNGKWCPYCSNKKLCGDADCMTCHEKSFASHSRAANWHPTLNGTTTPRDVTRSTHKKYWVVCEKGHNFDSAPANVTRGKWCPVCNQSHGEHGIMEHLQLLSVDYTQEYRFDDCRSVRPLPFDFAVFDSTGHLILLIEFDGIQHFESSEFLEV